MAVRRLGLTNLLPGTIYHFQAIGTNGAGTNYGGDLTFTNLPGVPSVTTLAVTNLTPAGVTFPALVNPNGGAATVYFAYGTTTNYFAQTADQHRADHQFEQPATGCRRGGQPAARRDLSLSGRRRQQRRAPPMAPI